MSVDTDLAFVRDPHRQENKSTIEEQTDAANQENRRHDSFQAQRIPAIPDEETDPDAARQHLARDDHQPGHSEAEAQSGEDMRQTEWDEDRSQVAATRAPAGPPNNFVI